MIAGDLAIDRVEVFTVGPPTQRLAWALDMEGQYMTFVLLRLTTRGGLVGLAGAASYGDHGYDVSVMETLRPMVPALLGRSVLEREAIWRAMHSRTLPRAPQAQSLIDVALWDILGKQAGVPLYALLGGARAEMPAYASTPLLADPDAYVAAVDSLHREGFRAIKFHCWCEPERDLALVHAVARAFPDPPVALMLDVEQRYDFDSAMRVGRVLGERGYAWFEAPLDDFDLLGYQRLTAKLDVPIVPAGNSILDARQVAFALQNRCWGKVRSDVMVCGGFTGGLRLMALAAAHGLTAEFQCWGYTLHQAANLHLMLSQPHATYFEQPTNYDVFEYASLGGIRPDAAGMVRAPDVPGLGFDIDMAAIESACLGKFEIRG